MKNKLNEEHFTISNRGVVHIFKKNTKRMSEDEITQTEFIFTSDWMREATLFNVLTSIKFFKNYLIGKIFSQWRSDVRYKRFVKTRQKLAQTLKFVIPAFQPTFVQVNNTLYEMQKTKCFQELKPNKQYDIETFGAEQKKERENSKDFYDKKIETITKKLEDLIKEVTESSNIRIDEEFENHKLGQKVKHKAMTVQKFEEQTRVNVMRLRRNNIASLGIFIRLVDYMAVEAQVKINQDAADLVYSEMTTEDRKAGITWLIQYDEEGMAFDPPEGEFVQSFEKLLTDIQTVCSDIARVITHPQFNQYTQGLSSDTGLRFKDIVEGSESYRLTKRLITNKFVDDFAQFRKETVKFEDWRVVNQFDSEFNFHEFKKAEYNLKSIQEKLEQLRKWEILVSSSIKAQINRGLVFVSGKRLRDKLIGAVRNAIKDIRDYLSDLAEAKSQEILDGLRVTRRSLAKGMSNLGEYVEYVKALNESKMKLEQLSEEKSSFEEMSSILRKSSKSKDINAIVATGTRESTLQTRYETIIAELENWRNDISAKEALVAGGQPEMLLVLDRNIIEVKEKIAELASKINVGNLIQAATPSTEAWGDLEKLKKKFEESKKRAEAYIMSQQILGQQATEIEELDDFEKKWEIRYRLWKARDDWDQDRVIWYDTPFPGQDALEIEKRIKEYEREVTWVKQSLPRENKDEVYEKLNEDVRGVSAIKELIIDLGNKALQERHMIKIFALLSEGNTYSPSRSYTLSELINAGILEVKDKVGEIAATASGEYAISQTLDGVKKVWATMEFIVINYRDIKDKFILGTIEEIMMRLEDDQVSIQTMLGSKNVHEIRSSVEE